MEEEEDWAELQQEEEPDEDIWGDIDIDGNEVMCSRPEHAKIDEDAKATKQEQERAQKTTATEDKAEEKQEQKTKREIEEDEETNREEKQGEETREANNPARKNPALVEGRRDFPQYEWDAQESETAKWFTGAQESRES